MTYRGPCRRRRLQRLMLGAHAWMVTLKGFRLTVTHPFSSSAFQQAISRNCHMVVGRQVNGVCCPNQCVSKQL